MADRVNGKIRRPRDGDRVPRHFLAEGTVDALSAGQHLFLAVEVDGLIWPKGEARIQGTAWTCEVREEGTPPDGRFGLSLYLVSDRGAESIAAWLERGRLTDDYPGLYQIDGSSRLDNHFLRLK